MASQQGKWRDEQILVICPGSQTTMAQYGVGDLTPAALRLPTRMFKDEEEGGYLAYHTHKRKKTTPNTNGTTQKDDETTKGDEDEWEWVEDRDSSEGAIYPIKGGRIVNMKAFLAFIDHVHGLLTTTYHNTPILLMGSPQWTRPDLETIAMYIFEKTKTPALCILHSGVAVQYGLKWPTVTVVDIGHEKVDVTCIHDSMIVKQDMLGFPCPDEEISGGEVFTQKLLGLLKDKSFTYDMAEQLKKSSVCEVLPYVWEHPDLVEYPTEGEPGADTSAAPPPSSIVAAAAGTDTSKPGEAAQQPPPPLADPEPENPEAQGEDGVVDVANIVTTGNTREFLAKKEKEKQEKAAKGKKGKGQEAETASARVARLPNSKRKYNTFHYEHLVHEDVQVPVYSGEQVAEVAKPPITGDNTTTAEGQGQTSDPNAMSVDETKPATDATTATPATEEAGKAEAADGGAAGEEAKPNPEASESALPAPAPKPTPAPEPSSYVTERRTKRVRKDIEVGLERFRFADRREIDRIVRSIYLTIQGIDDMYKRAACWDNIVFVGNGSRLQGLKENIIQTLTARHLISPSNATIFTSELPSNMATPTGTGAQTPTSSVAGQLPLPSPAAGPAGASSSVNPLLQAATTASTLGTNAAGGSNAGGDVAGGSLSSSSHHHSHGQTPMSIKTANFPSYLAEWTKHGFEECMFLGSLVAARIVFTIHNHDQHTLEAQRMSLLTRMDYNEHGPAAVRSHSLFP